MTDYAVCTSWSESGRALYGNRFLSTFVDHWPNSIRLYVYEEGEPQHHEDGRVVMRPMPSRCTKWKARHQDDPTKNGRIGTAYSFKYDAIRFVNKVFAIADAHETARNGFDHLIWLDGDIVTHAVVDDEWLDRFTPRDDELCSYLGRAWLPENGFIMFNLKHPMAIEFIDSWLGIYETDTLFRLKEWHDCFTFWIHLNTWNTKGYKSRNIGDSRAPEGYHIFIKSGLGERMDHMKGQRKNVGHSRWEDVRYTDNAQLKYWQNIGKKSD